MQHKVFVKQQFYFLLVVIGMSFSCQTSLEQNRSKFISWDSYLGDPHRTHFSLLDHIDTTNVGQLRLVWEYKSGGTKRGNSTQIQTNPIIIGHKLFGVSADMKLFALDASTGTPLWIFNPPDADSTGLGRNRGLAYWESTDKAEELLFFSVGSKLFAIDPVTGTVAKEFGDRGFVDLRAGLDREVEMVSVVANAPGAIFEDLIIMGSRVQETPGAAPGYIRAYHVRSGELVWTFHTIPYPGEYGNDTWPAESYKRSGGANNWTGMAVDSEEGLVFIPTGSASFDFYGGDRPGDNLFANCLLALDARTGKRVWHYQFVHHDIWDRDLPAPPNLVTINRGGTEIPAVAQITKSGHVFVFHRLTGEPLFPINEKEYPASKMIGEQTASTQPSPELPQPFARQSLGEGDLFAPDELAFVDDFIDNEQNTLRMTVLEKFRSVTSKGQFIPLDTTGVVVFPGFDGGGEWGGAAVDPRKGVLYVNSNEMPWIARLEKVRPGRTTGRTLFNIYCSRCHGSAMQGIDGTPSIKNVSERRNRNAVSEIIKHGLGAMPSFTNLSEPEINSIVSYLFKESGEEAVIEVSMDSLHGSNQLLPYSIAGFGRFKDIRGYPAVKPPWGTLNAIDLSSGEYLWKVPLGNDTTVNNIKYKVTGTENYGGPVVTAGGLVFIAATRDEKFRAFDARSGKCLWEVKLPAGGYATPATYQVNGKQYVVITCGGGKMGTKSGDSYVAYSLP